MKKLVAVAALLLAATTASAQYQGGYKPGTGGSGGGAPTFPLLAPTGCGGSLAAPQYSVDVDTNAGLCFNGANNVFLQTGGSAATNRAVLSLNVVSAGLSTTGNGGDITSFSLVNEDDFGQASATLRSAGTGTYSVAQLTLHGSLQSLNTFLEFTPQPNNGEYIRFQQRTSNPLLSIVVNADGNPFSFLEMASDSGTGVDAHSTHGVVGNAGVYAQFVATLSNFVPTARIEVGSLNYIEVGSSSIVSRVDDFSTSNATVTQAAADVTTDINTHSGPDAGYSVSLENDPDNNATVDNRVQFTLDTEDDASMFLQVMNDDTFATDNALFSMSAGENNSPNDLSNIHLTANELYLDSPTSVKSLRRADAAAATFGGKFLLSLVQGGYSLSSQNPTSYPTPVSVKVTIVDTTPSIVDGDVQVCGFQLEQYANEQGPAICETLDFSGGAGNQTTTATFVQIVAIKASSFSVLGGGGDETILVEFTDDNADIVTVTNLVNSTKSDFTTGVLANYLPTTYTNYAALSCLDLQGCDIGLFGLTEVDGKELQFVVASSYPVRFVEDSSTKVAGSDVTLDNYDTIRFIFSGLHSAWLQVSNTAN